MIVVKTDRRSAGHEESGEWWSESIYVSRRGGRVAAKQKNTYRCSGCGLLLVVSPRPCLACAVSTMLGTATLSSAEETT